MFDKSIPIHKKVEGSKITATWSWYDQQQGLVKWTFSNPTSEIGAVVLFRSGYYFGNAFWPVYEANGQFGVLFAPELKPLVDNGVEKNAPPLAVVEMSGKYIVCFVFTLAPGQEWSMLEGGFLGFDPTGVATYDVVSSTPNSMMCIGYAQQQVTDWDEQTGTQMTGYEPNPSEFNVVVCKVNAPYVQLFPDPISAGSCSMPLPCTEYLTKAETYLEAGNIIEAVLQFLNYVECLEKQAMLIDGVKTKLKEFIHDVMTHF